MPCTMCGACCRRFSVPSITIYNYRPFMRKHPFLVQVDWGGTDDCIVPIFDCKRLQEVVGGKFICTEYENRPAFCRNFPQPGQYRPAKCSMEKEPIPISVAA